MTDSPAAHIAAIADREARATELRDWLRAEAEDERSWSTVPAHLDRAKKMDEFADDIDLLLALAERQRKALGQAALELDEAAKLIARHYSTAATLFTKAAETARRVGETE